MISGVLAYHARRAAPETETRPLDAGLSGRVARSALFEESVVRRRPPLGHRAHRAPVRRNDPGQKRRLDWPNVSLPRRTERSWPATERPRAEMLDLVFASPLLRDFAGRTRRSYVDGLLPWSTGWRLSPGPPGRSAGIPRVQRPRPDRTGGTVVVRMAGDERTTPLTSIWARTGRSHVRRCRPPQRAMAPHLDDAEKTGRLARLSRDPAGFADLTLACERAAVSDTARRDLRCNASPSLWWPRVAPSPTSPSVTASKCNKSQGGGLWE